MILDVLITRLRAKRRPTPNTVSAIDTDALPPYNRLMHYHGPQVIAIVTTCRDLRNLIIPELPPYAARTVANMIDGYADGVITAEEE